MLTNYVTTLLELFTATWCEQRHHLLAKAMREAPAVALVATEIVAEMGRRLVMTIGSVAAAVAVANVQKSHGKLMETKGSAAVTTRGAVLLLLLLQ